MADKETVTAAVIAKELGVSDAKVKKAIEALGIAPAAMRGICKLYSPETIEAVRAKLG
jgi:hypothetical protein